MTRQLHSAHNHIPPLDIPPPAQSPEAIPPNVAYLTPFLPECEAQVQAEPWCPCTPAECHKEVKTQAEEGPSSKREEVGVK